MAQAPTIPVRIREDGYRDEGEVVQIAYDTLIIPANDLPAVDHVDIFPYAPHYKRHFRTKHFEIRYRKDLTFESWMYFAPARKERRPGGGRKRLAGDYVDEFHPLAGQVIAHVSPIPLHRVEVGHRVFFQRDGGWDQGRVEGYVHAFEAKRAQMKAKSKADAKKRKRARYPSVWDRISSDD